MQFALHPHQLRVQQHVTLFVGDLFPDDEVAAAGLVLQCDERDAARSARTLFGNDQSSDPHMQTGFERLELLCRDITIPVEVAANQLHGVTSQGEAETLVVSDDVLALRRAPQHRRRLETVE